LNVLNGAVATGSGTWSSTTGGFWNVASRWTGGAIANGSGNTATISAASAITVTLDRNETLGHLVFQGNNHTLNGDNYSSLTLAGTVPSVTVASGTSSRINAVIAGTSGLAKVGAGTLTLGGVNKTYSGGTAVNEGRLVLADILTGSSNYTIASGANLEFNSTGNANRQLSGGTISGSGNLVKSGRTSLCLRVH
jgi:autotransporter-associated beta strand protein